MNIRQKRRFFPLTAIVVVAILIFPLSLLASDEASHGSPYPGVLDMIIRIINFAILAVLLVKFLSKPIGNYLNARADSIRTRIETLQKEKEEAERILKNYVDKQRMFEDEIRRAKDEASAEMERERDQIIDEAHQVANEIIGHARETIKREANRAKAELHAEAVDLSMELAEGLIRKKINDKDHRRFAEDYIRIIARD